MTTTQKVVVSLVDTMVVELGTKVEALESLQHAEVVSADTNARMNLLLLVEIAVLNIFLLIPHRIHLSPQLHQQACFFQETLIYRLLI